MGGFFGVASENDCSEDLFYGTDYHSHLGTCRGGLAVLEEKGTFVRFIHDISNAQFRSKFESDITQMHGRSGIGVISDNESQPLIIGSHLGIYAIVTVGIIKNAEELAAAAFTTRATHFSEMSGSGINPTELIATLINREATFEDGIRAALEAIHGSCSVMLLTDRGIYAGRDKFGRTPIIVGRKEGARALTFETTAFYNLGYQHEYELGPNEVVRVTADGVESLKPAGEALQICAFHWVYYGFPASTYEGVNVEVARNRCGAALARRDGGPVADFVGGIPDSGTGHAIGYANESKIPYARPFAKYTPTWPRSFMPQIQEQRNLVARMKLIPIPDLIRGKRLLFCEDSIVRGTQLRDTVQRLFDAGAKEVHMRPACPPLVFSCPYLGFSRSRSALDLAARDAILTLEGKDDAHLDTHADPESDKYNAMVETIRKKLNLTTLKYQRLDDMVEAIGLPKEKMCTYCWDGCTGGCKWPE